MNPSWKATVGYTEAGDQWDNPTSQTVSCDSNGTKYVLGQTVFEGTQLTGVSAALQSNSTQWVVNLTLNSAGHRGVRQADHHPVQRLLPDPSRQPERRRARLDGDRA